MTSTDRVAFPRRSNSPACVPLQALAPTDPAFEIRPAVSTDAPSMAALFQQAYQASSHPCQSAEFIARSIDGGRDLWIIARAGDKVVGCVCGVWHEWNGLYELGRAVTSPEHRRHGLGSRLHDLLLRQIYEVRGGEMTIGFPRSGAMMKLVCEDQAIASVIVGHDGGINVANGLREVHLVSVTTRPGKALRRIVPAGAPRCMEFAEEALLPKLHIESEPGDYPDARVVGPAGAEARTASGFTIGFDYDPACGSRSMHVTSLEGPAGRSDRDAAAALDEFLREGPAAEHVFAYVLLDKVELIEEMRARGFEVSAYLPTFYPQNGRRYDCLMLARRTSAKAPVAHGVQDVVDALRAGFESEAEAASRPAAAAA